MFRQLKGKAFAELLERERFAAKAKLDEQTDDLQGFPSFDAGFDQKAPRPVPPCRAYGLLDDYETTDRLYES